MTVGPIPICASCARFSSPVGGLLSDDRPPTCAAFPAGIPEEIIDGGLDHREPVAGDNGITWALGSEPDAERMLALYEEVTAPFVRFLDLTDREVAELEETPG